MVLDSVFTPGLIKLNLESEDKEEAFEELVDLFVSRNPSASREKLLSALLAREAKLSTGVRQGFALPHAQTDQVSSVQGIIGISRSGVDYDALDGKPVHVIFVLFCSADSCTFHLRALKKLSMLLEEPDFLGDILSQSDAESVLRVLTRFEEKLAAL